jgi:hypothetical protein
VDSVVVSKPSVFLGKTSERLVVRGPRPDVTLIDGEPQLTLPLSFSRPEPVSAVTSSETRKPPLPLGRLGAAATKAARQEQVQLPLFRVSEIIITAPGVSISTDLIEECCEHGIRITRPNRWPPTVMRDAPRSRGPS